MKKSIFFPILTFLLAIGFSINLSAQNDLLITAVYDGPLTGGLPKGVEIYVINDVADLSVYGVSSVSNGGGTVGTAELVFDAVSATAGDFIYVATEQPMFNTWFGFDPDYVTTHMSINGDDAIEIYHTPDAGTTWNVVDVFGDVDADGTGTAWEYLDGWAYRVSTTPSVTFDPADWTFSGPDALDGETDNASAATPIPAGTFTLGGGALAFPFVEPFETWPLENWTVEGSGTYVWEEGDGTSYGPGSVFEGTLAAMFDVYSASTGNTTTMTTDVIDMSSPINPILQFQYWMNGSSDANLWIRAEMSTDGSTWTEVFYQQQDGTISDWTEAKVQLTGYNSTTQIRITGSSDYGMYNLYIDDLQIYEGPTNTMDWSNLQWPDVHTMLTNETVTVYARGYEAGITDAVGQGANVECWIGYSDTDSDPSTWTNWVAATYNTDTDGDSNDEYQADLGPLASGTYYYASRWRVEEGPMTYGGFVGGPWDGTSNVSGVLTVNALLGAECSNPYIVDIPTALPYTDAAATTCGLGDTYNLGTTSYDNGEDAIYELTVTADTYVRISMDPNATTWTSLFIFDGCPDTGSLLDSYENSGSETREIDIALTAGTYYVMVDVYPAPDCYTYDLTIEEICPDPINIMTNNLTATSTDIEWTEAGFSTAWNIKVNEGVAIDPTLVDGDIVANDAVSTTPTYTIPDPTLTPETDYYVYVQSDCGSEWVEYMFTTISACPIPTTLDASVVIDDVTLTWDELGQTDWNIKIHSSVLADPDIDPADIEDAVSGVDGEYIVNDLAIGTYYWYVQSSCGSAWANGTFYVGYCLPAPSSVDGSGITNVTFGQNIVVNNATGTETNNYGDYSAMIGDGAQGLELAVDITYETSYTYGTKIWVDWNNDLEFNDVDELMYTGLSTSANPTTLNASFIVPIATPLGQYRMRIGGTDGDLGPGDACYTGSYGSFEDYTLEVIAAPACMPPTDLDAYNITTDNAELSWTDNGEMNWNLVAATAPFDPTSETGDFGVIPVLTNPFIIPPGTLAPNTTYYWYIQADCGGSTSLWSSEGSFTTECASFAAPFAEGFDVYEIECWEEAEGILADPTILTTSSSTWMSDDFANAGDVCVKVNNYGTTTDEWMITPAINLGDGSINYFLTFDLALTDWNSTNVADPAPDDVFAVVISTDNGATWSSANTLMVWDNIGSPNVYDNIATAGELVTIDLAAYTGEVKFGFYAESTVSNGDNDLFIDNLQVRELSDENDIIDFVLADQTGAATIDAGAHTVNIEVSMGTDLATLTPTITISDLATINPLSGVQQDFTGSDVTPFEYTVTSESGLPQIWEVTVTEALTLSSDNDILTWTFPEETGAAIIDPIGHTVTIEVNWLADLNNLTPTITTSPFSTINPLSDVANDFSSSPVIYTVEAQDGTPQDWEIYVNQEAAPMGANCSNPFIVSIPADLTYQDLSASTCGLGDVYTTTGITSDYYDNGEDAIYEITVTADTYVRMTMDPQSTTWTSLSLFDGCPDTGNLIDEYYSSGSEARVIDVALSTGTYYAMIDIWPTPDCYTYDFTIEEICGTPMDIEAINLTSTSAEIQWTVGGFETNWFIEVSSTTITDPDTETGDIEDNTVVSTTPLHSLSGLLPETTYYVYVQADCLGDWSTEYSFTTPAACPIPTGLTATVLGPNDVDLAWDELGTSDWVLEVSTTPLTDPGTETGDILDNEIVVGAVGEYNLSGLTAATTYYWYVMSDCGSAWSIEGSFTTDCEILGVPYFEGFEDISMPSCWSILNLDADANEWEIGTGNSDPYEGAQTASISYNVSGNDDWLISPQFDITDDNTALDFYAKSRSASFLENFNVLISTTGKDPADFTIVLDNIVDHPTTWELHSYILSDYGITSGQQIYVAIQSVSVNEWELYIDAFELYVAPEINEIDVYTQAVDITVCEGTDEATAIADLVPQISVTDTDATEHVVDVTWAIASYDGMTPATYNATGTFDLPAGVAQTDPATVLEVYATVTVDPIFDPTFTLESAYCQGATADVLPTTSDNAITGTWAPAAIDTDIIGDTDYIFTPDAGVCANPFTLTVTVTEVFTPEFSFATVYCMGDTPDLLPATSDNALTGTWAPAVIATDVAGDFDYIFTPDATCDEEVTITVTINDPSAPATFSFADEYCLGDTPDALPTTSDNMITGTWAPAVIATDVVGSSDYVFTPDAGQCAIGTTISVTINDPVEATFSFTDEYCLGDTPDALPTTSDNMITGTWAPAVIATDVVGSADYVFTPDAGQCGLETTISVTINDPVEATFSFAAEYCIDGTPDALPTTSDNMITGTWAPAVIATDVAGTTDYVFTPDAGQCGLETTISVTINELPVVTCPATMAMTSADEAVTLTGATPEGGEYTGTNVTAGVFDPDGLAIGAYTITYTYTDPVTGCVNSCDFIIDIVTEIENTTVEGIGIYPNPNNGEFVINFNNIEGDVTYQLYDTKGSIIVLKDVSANGNTVEEISVDLVPGVYYVKVVTASQTYVEKLVVE